MTDITVISWRMWYQTTVHKHHSLLSKRRRSAFLSSGERRPSARHAFRWSWCAERWHPVRGNQLTSHPVVSQTRGPTPLKQIQVQVVNMEKCHRWSVDEGDRQRSAHSYSTAGEQLFSHYTRLLFDHLPTQILLVITYWETKINSLISLKREENEMQRGIIINWTEWKMTHSIFIECVTCRVSTWLQPLYNNL